MTSEVKPYGYCPICGDEGVSRERRPHGNDRCGSGHTYPSRDARAAVEASHPAAEVTDEMVRERWPWVGRVLLPSYRERLRAELASGKPAPKAEAVTMPQERPKSLERIISERGYAEIYAAMSQGGKP